MGGSIQKGRNRERTPWQPPLDSAPPVNTDDSEPALDRVPQPLGDRKPQRFRRTLKTGPFLRNAPNRTGTTHPVTHGRRASTKNDKRVKEISQGCHANFSGNRDFPRADVHTQENVAHLRRLGFAAIGTQRLRAGLMSFASPALRLEPASGPPRKAGPTRSPGGA